MKNRLLWTAALALILVGCSDNKEQLENTEKETEQQQPVPKNEISFSGEQLTELIEMANSEAFSTNEHEGEIVLQETHMLDQQTKASYRHTTSYRQNEAQEGMYGEHQLYYKRHLDGYEQLPINYEAYVQPDVAFYTFSDSAGWQGYDFQSVGELGIERLAYLSPADVLSMLEMNPDSNELISVDDELVVTAFEPIAEDQMTLLYSILEPQSIYHQTDMPLQVKDFSIQLTFERGNEALSVVDVQIELENVDNDKETLTYIYKQAFTSYMLTDEIRPSDAVFANSGLSLWDY